MPPGIVVVPVLAPVVPVQQVVVGVEGRVLEMGHKLVHGVGMRLELQHAELGHELHALHERHAAVQEEELARWAQHHDAQEDERAREGEAAWDAAMAAQQGQWIERERQIHKRVEGLERVQPEATQLQAQGLQEACKVAATEMAKLRIKLRRAQGKIYAWEQAQASAARVAAEPNKRIAQLEQHIEESQQIQHVVDVNSILWDQAAQLEELEAQRQAFLTKMEMRPVKVVRSNGAGSLENIAWPQISALHAKEPIGPPLKLNAWMVGTMTATTIAPSGAVLSILLMAAPNGSVESLGYG